jgi:hypothetical protein
VFRQPELTALRQPMLMGRMRIAACNRITENLHLFPVWGKSVFHSKSFLLLVLLRLPYGDPGKKHDRDLPFNKEKQRSS